MAKPKKATPDDANDVVLKYLRKQNRPYSAVDVFNNLAGQVGKTIVTKCLTSLAEEQQIHAKLNGKQWVYVAKQDDIEVPSRAELDSMDVKIAALKEEVQGLKEETRQAQSKLSSLRNSLTNAQIEESLEALNKENARLAQRLQTAQSGAGAQQLSKADRDRIDNEVESMRKEWRKRKRMFDEMFGAVTENLQGSLAEFREAVGIETDQAAGVDLKDDPIKL
ncbi:homologous-pairing protein 2 [Phlyctochytrium arcticum]|nr:homologous-pairing protein 2 [Phlyctochytrium arcticum]